MIRLTSTLAILVAVLVTGVHTQQPQTRPLRIIAFGAHPDDAELKAAASPRSGRRAGHKVKFVAMTNGDIGHFEKAGGPLAQRRKAEVAECARILGIETEVLDIHDGELSPRSRTAGRSRGSSATGRPTSSSAIGRTTTTPTTATPAC